MSKVNPRKPSNIRVNVLDLSAEEQSAFDYMQDKEHRDDLKRCRVSNTWGFVETPTGIYLLCDEGVGEREPVSDENPAKFFFTREFNGGGFEMFPCVSRSLGAEDLLTVPVKKVVSLDKFIRVHNSRLEQNFEKWEDFLSREMKRPKTDDAREKMLTKKEEEAFAKSSLAELIEA